ncbi:SMC1 [Symbiodinium necroappetens]|uniref:SMC1 protein n=1 Tax=Symbiodinium necroappetens TaxID=1628268 RepID=A0A812TC25_9DINO|nr:SMC1 [Symbiodinium necroappetens]
MVRSLASSDSPPSYSEGSDSEDGSESPTTAAARERAARERVERHWRNLQSWNRRRLVATLCEQAYAEQLATTECSVRQVAGRLSAFKRRCNGRDADGLVEFTLPQLEPPRSDNLRHDVATVLRLYDGQIPPNDRAWILSEQVGRLEDPGRKMVEQQFELLLQRSLAPQLRTTAAQEFVHRAIANAGGSLYRDFMLLLWPLLSTPDRFRFQQWYQSRHQAEPDEPREAIGTAEDEDENMDRVLCFPERWHDTFMAYDKLPRPTLERALIRVNAPPDLISLILYIHDNAKLILEKHGHEEKISLGRGIRQGCGLSPLLWLAFTILLQDQFQSFLPKNVTTGYADDYEMQWEFEHASEFRNACVQVEMRQTYRNITRGVIKEVSLHRLMKTCHFCKDRNCKDWHNNSKWTASSSSFKMSLTDAQEAELQNAQSELAQFASNMKKEVSTAAPSVASQASQEEGEMDVDRSREKRAEATSSAPEEPPQKWAKGEAKGETRQEEATTTGKGGTAPTQRSPPRARDKGPEAPGRVWRQDQNRQGYQSWNRNQGNRYWGQDRQQGGARGSRNSDSAVKDLVRAVARLSLRQEDQQAIAGLDTDFVFFLQSSKTGNPRSVTDALYKTAQDWNTQKEREPSSLTQPMRNVLLYCLLSTLLERVEILETDSQELDKVREQGLVIGEAYPYLQWDSTLKKHVPSQTEPLDHKTAVEMIKMALRLSAFPGVVGRFHALRNRNEKTPAEVIPFSLQVQNRTQESHQMWVCMNRLSRCSCWHLLAGTMRPGKLGRSPLAKTIEHLLQDF